jgi:hypothetical protein
MMSQFLIKYGRTDRPRRGRASTVRTRLFRRYGKQATIDALPMMLSTFYFISHIRKRERMLDPLSIFYIFLNQNNTE